MMITNVIRMFISYLLDLVNGLFLLFDDVRGIISGILGVNVTVEAWFAFWLFVVLAVSTYVLSSRRGVVEPITISAEAGPESTIAFKAEKVAMESALEFLQDAFRRGEVSEQLYATLKSLYSDKLDKVNERLASLSKVEEFKGIEFELEEAKREFLERLKAPTITEKARAEEPAISREIVSKQVPELVSREVTSPRIEEPKVETFKEAKIEVKPASTVPPPPKGETLVQALRDEMLKELRRLKEIIEKSS